MSSFMEKYGHLIDQTTIRIISCSIAKSLRKSCAANMDFEELCNWGNLGITQAIQKFDQSQMDKVDVEDPQRWICGYLTKKGYYLTIDILRSEHLIGRFRYGKFYSQVLPSVTMTDAGAMNYSRSQIGINSIHKVDDQAVEPAYAAEKADMLAVIDDMAKDMTESEQRVLQLRYKQGLEFSEIAVEMKLSQARVHQINTALLKKIRQELCPA